MKRLALPIASVVFARRISMKLTTILLMHADAASLSSGAAASRFQLSFGHSAAWSAASRRFVKVQSQRFPYFVISHFMQRREIHLCAGHVTALPKGETCIRHNPLFRFHKQWRDCGRFFSGTAAHLRRGKITRSLIRS